MTRHGEYTGVILASGRGSRLGAATAERPKCLVELDGRPLLDWQIAALHEAGISRIVVTTGYRHEMIAARGVETVHNPDWAHTNMVASLLCALEVLPPPLLVSYSDIVYAPAHVGRLLECSAELAITCDTDWLELWQRRFDDPLADAETLVMDEEGWLQEIGGEAGRLADIQGQFMGLIKLSAAGASWIRELVSEDPGMRSGLDTTALLQSLIDCGRPIRGATVANGWCEIDDHGDLQVAEAMLKEGRLRPPSP